MNLAAASPNLALSAWQNLYVIIGSSAGALIGLQFVVIALIADRDDLADMEAINAFGTPTVVHFSGALIVSAIMSVPWASLLAASIPLIACGIGGLAYAAVVFRRARRQKNYTPELQDWLWYTILPCVAYACLTVAALLVPTRTSVALFMVGGAALGLLLVAIRNAWDTVIYIGVIGQQSRETKSE